MVKNPNWKEVNQLAIFTSMVKDLKSGLTEKESSKQSKQDMNSGSLDYKSLDTFLSKSFLNYSTMLSLSLKVYYDYINTLQKVTNCASYKIMKN